MTDTMDRVQTAVMENLQGTRDVLAVSRVFGDPVTIGDVTIIPVAKVSGGAGGGGGSGTDEDQTQEGRGFGTGFGMGARAIGVYEVRGEELSWKPAVDTTQLLHGSQVLAGIVAVCVSLVLLRHRC